MSEFQLTKVTHSRASHWWQAGTPWVWLTAGAVSVSLISVLGLLLLIGWKGLVYFWPTPVYQWQDSQGQTLIGQVYQVTKVPLSHLSVERQWPDKVIEQDAVERLSIKIANRDRYGHDFISVLKPDLHQPSQPKSLVVVERNKDGDFLAQALAWQDGQQRQTDNLVPLLQFKLAYAKQIREQMADITDNEMYRINSQLEALRLAQRSSKQKQPLSAQQIASFEQQKQALEQAFTQQEAQLDSLRAHLDEQFLLVRDMTGEEVALPLENILDAWFPNDMNQWQKVQHWFKQVGKFIADDPRDANSDGGVFPAIFGTVLMVILMSVVVMPLGVIAAIYLHEYAQPSALTRIIRIAVVNLAGVPSIVYGVFGLGFFVYTIGSTLDELFYSSALPSPTFGTPGLLWSALTLAVLTLPVVIVATEEGLARIPSSVRNGSYALGATKFETIWRIVLPIASPAMMTGLILAVARAAGEVAPLMLVGVVKLAPSLPVDSFFPYLHLERKFMHLGFHIYDVGFQTPNIEAARPLVFATSFLLITVVVVLNITAISIRNNLREKFRVMGQD